MGTIGKLLFDQGVTTTTVYNGARTARFTGTFSPINSLADNFGDGLWLRYGVRKDQVPDPQPGIGHLQRATLLLDVAKAALKDGFFDTWKIPHALTLDSEDVSDIAYLFGGEGLLSPIWRQYGQPLALGPDPVPGKKNPSGLDKHIGKHLERITPLAFTAEDMAAHGYSLDPAGIGRYYQDVAQGLRRQIGEGIVRADATPAEDRYTFVTVPVNWFLEAEAALSKA